MFPAIHNAKFAGACLILTMTAASAIADDQTAAGDDQASLAERGYRLLTTKPYLPPDFHEDDFNEVWQTWEQPSRDEAAAASPEKRRLMAFTRYGLTPRDDDPMKPLQYVVDEQGHWTMNCFACHQGKVAGQVIPGAPNSRFALETLSEEMRATKLRLGHPLVRMDKASLVMPLGTTRGTTNAVIFGVALMALRDPDLNLVVPRGLPFMKHHDHEPPALWQLHRKERLYIDGFAPKSHRAMMQFLLVRQNGPEKFREWEDDFRAVYAYFESLRPPQYPFELDQTMAASGRAIFERRCAECHGTYGPEGTYPERCVPIDDVGTDRTRFDALLPEYRQAYGESWFARNDEERVDKSPEGYVAPPLDGVWATAPYFHNGSAPTLRHVLSSPSRPVVWRRTEDGYDRKNVGIEVEVFDGVPAKLSSAERRDYFDARLPGKAAGGHAFADDLTEEERWQLLEYLKCL